MVELRFCVTLYDKWIMHDYNFASQTLDLQKKKKKNTTYAMQY